MREVLHGVCGVLCGVLCGMGGSSGRNWQICLPTDFMINVVAMNAPVPSILLHAFSMLNFCGRPIVQTFYSMNANFSLRGKFPNLRYYSKHVLVTCTGKMWFHTQNI